MNSCRVKLGILLAIVAFAFVVSQIVYRNTITTLHDSVSYSDETLEIVQNAESIHSSIHMMLYLASRYAERKDENAYQEYNSKRASARNSIDALIKSAAPGGHQYRVKDAPIRQSSDLHSLFHAFAVETDAVFTGANRIIPPIWTRPVFFLMTSSETTLP